MNYIDLGLPSKILWANCNVGSDFPEFYGDYFDFYGAQEQGTVPTKDNWKELVDSCKWEWCEDKFRKGYEVIGKNGNSIFLPTAGRIWKGSGAIGNSETDGFYWTSSLENENVAVDIAFCKSEIDCDGYSSIFEEQSVRLVKIKKDTREKFNEQIEHFKTEIKTVILGLLKILKGQTSGKENEINGTI